MPITFEVKRGTPHIHHHWFIYVTTDTEIEAWVANRVIDESCKDLGRFCQVNRSVCGFRPRCDIHSWDCPGTYGWEMWSLDLDDPEGETRLNERLPILRSQVNAQLARFDLNKEG